MLPGLSHEARRTRCRLDVRGRVQGVGFRPFAYRLATALKLAGLVGNDVHGAFIEIEGPLAAVESFVAWLWQGSSTARVTDVEVSELDPAAIQPPVGFFTG